MPHSLKNKYQFLTKANISFLKKIDYKKTFLNIKKGINLTLR